MQIHVKTHPDVFLPEEATQPKLCVIRIQELVEDGSINGDAVAKPQVMVQDVIS